MLALRPFSSGLWALLLVVAYCDGFAPTTTTTPKSIPTHLFAARRPVDEARRQILLSREGSHFKLDRFSGSIEFGATANLVTQLDVPLVMAANEDVDHDALVSEWLQDERGMALSIWDPALTKDLGSNMYRLQIMKLQFVTLQLAPWVDVQMKTVMTKNDNKPLFTLQSISFDPNVQILPGMRINAESLGIVIEVAGQMRPSQSGVTGTIAFQTSGQLPPPLRVLPEAALKKASDTINQTIVNFAVRSFQKGAKKNYKDFLVARTQMQAAAK